MQYLDAGLYPVRAPSQLVMVWKGKLSPSLWPEVNEQYKAKSLRKLADEYGVSREAIRRTLAVIRPQAKLAEK